MLISGEKILMSAELKESVTWFIYFLDLLWVRYNCAKFHHCRICVTDFREGGAFFGLPPICEQPQKSPSWIGLSLFIKMMILLIKLIIDQLVFYLCYLQLLNAGYMTKFMNILIPYYPKFNVALKRCQYAMLIKCYDWKMKKKYG